MVTPRTFSVELAVKSNGRYFTHQLVPSHIPCRLMISQLLQKKTTATYPDLATPTTFYVELMAENIVCYST